MKTLFQYKANLTTIQPKLLESKRQAIQPVDTGSLAAEQNNDTTQILRTYHVTADVHHSISHTVQAASQADAIDKVDDGDLTDTEMTTEDDQITYTEITADESMMETT